MVTELGLRERKKLKTRQQIYETAHRMFAKRGFDGVTVAEVARAAEVSEPTVFSYFPTKEDLFFGGLEFFEQHLVEAVAERTRGESASAAFLRVLLEGSKRLESQKNIKVITRAAKLISTSPALQTRELQIVSEYTRELAQQLAQESAKTADDIEAIAVANALMGLHRALVERVRKQVLEGESGPRVASEFRSLAKRGFGRLDRGLAAYSVKK